MLIQTDLFDTHQPPPAALIPAYDSLRNVVERLRLDAAHIVPIHGKPVAWTDFLRVVAKRTN